MEEKLSTERIILETKECLGQHVVVKKKIYDLHAIEGAHPDAETRRRLFNYIMTVLQQPRLILYDQDDPQSTRRRYIDFIVDQLFESVKVLIVVDAVKNFWVLFF